MNEKIKGIVNAVSGIKEHDGSLQIGWTLQANTKKWYNSYGEEKELKILLEKIIQSGNEVEFNYDTLGSEVSGLVRTKEAEKKADGSKWEDDIVSFETLLTAAHNLKKPFSIKTKMLDINLEKKYALFKATVEVYHDVKPCFGESVRYEGHGDATEENVTGSFIKPHFIRMAETRSICRALRWYTNNGCAEEEKGGEEKK